MSNKCVACGKEFSGRSYSAEVPICSTECIWAYWDWCRGCSYDTPRHLLDDEKRCPVCRGDAEYILSKLERRFVNELVDKPPFEIVRTAGKGLPAVWEEGGSSSSRGFAVIVAGPRGEKLRPVYVVRKGPRANERHALFVVRKGFQVFTAVAVKPEIVVRKYYIKDLNNLKVIRKEILAAHVRYMKGAADAGILEPAAAGARRGR